tara:strand:- start:2272 stop:3093 length:822 start_codon:yes stop_codon:yes gene_type:complete
MAWHFPETDWQPNVIKRVISPLKSSTLVVKVETDKGDAFLKGLGNPAGNESLAFELVGTRLARLVGLPTPDFTVITHDFLEIPKLDSSLVEFGPVFLSKQLEGSPGGGKAFLDGLINPETVPLLVAFDTWLTNYDRCPPMDALDPTPNWDNIFFEPEGRKNRLVVFDHTHCFAQGMLEDALHENSYRDDASIYGMFPEFSNLLDEWNLRKAVLKIMQVDAAAIQDVIAYIPDEWLAGATIRNEWSRQIIARRAGLEKTLLDFVTAQGRLEFPE